MKSKSWWYRTFGPVAPVLTAIVMVLGIIFVVVVIDFVNQTNNVLMHQVTDFLMMNLVFFFLIFLVQGYSRYVKAVHPNHHWKISPVSHGLGVVLVVWVFGWCFSILHELIGPSVNLAGFTLADIATGIYYLIFPLFLLAVVLGYALFFVRKWLNKKQR